MPLQPNTSTSFPIYFSSLFGAKTRPLIAAYRVCYLNYPIGRRQYKSTIQGCLLPSLEHRLALHTAFRYLRPSRLQTLTVSLRENPRIVTEPLLRPFGANPVRNAIPSDPFPSNRRIVGPPCERHQHLLNSTELSENGQIVSDQVPRNLRDSCPISTHHPTAFSASHHHHQYAPHTCLSAVEEGPVICLVEVSSTVDLPCLSLIST